MIKDIYKFIETLQERVGNGVHISLEVHLPQVLEFRFFWYKDEKLITYTRALSMHELYYIEDESMYLDFLIYKAKTGYIEQVTKESVEK